MSKTFRVAGVSTKGDKTKVRFAQELSRIKILDKDGHTGIDLIELPCAMTKVEAVQHLRSINFGEGNYDIEQALLSVEDRSVSKEKSKAKAKATVEVEETETEQAETEQAETELA